MWFQGRWAILATLAFADASELPEWLDRGLGHVRIAHEERTGRGLQATSDFAKGEEVLAVPLRHVFALENLENFFAEHPTSENLKDVMSVLQDLQDNSKLLPLDSLAVALAAYRFADWGKLLPQEMVHHPLFYTEDDWIFVENLVSSGVLRSVWNDFLQSWQRVKPLRPGLNQSDYQWAHAILRSRGHSLRIRRAEGPWSTIWGLIPLADFFNMGEDPNVECSTRYVPGLWGFQGSFSCITRRAVRRDENLLVEYISSSEKRTSAVILREYGFVPAENVHDALCFLPSDCAILSCMTCTQELAQLEAQLGESEGRRFIQEAFDRHALLTMSPRVDLNLLARHEHQLLLSLRGELERSQTPKVLYRQWRRITDDWERPRNSDEPRNEAGKLLNVLRDPLQLHTVAWDQAVWDAGQHLLKDWDDLLASELLFSHHDFVPELEQLFRRKRHTALEMHSRDQSMLQCAFSAQALLNGFAWPISDPEHAQLREVKDGQVRSMYFPEPIDHTICPRAFALQAEREWEINEPIRSCSGWSGGEPKVH
ncbi:unnamed protein product [Durusdinium trenchii]|uniref:SET domain-containing protein n=1 Tax=Durusdinium trenchii TaxID=1381693 RepID=A0ABP0MZW6_9DINO